MHCYNVVHSFLLQTSVASFALLLTLLYIGYSACAIYESVLHITRRMLRGDFKLLKCRKGTLLGLGHMVNKFRPTHLRYIYFLYSIFFGSKGHQLCRCLTRLTQLTDTGVPTSHHTYRLFYKERILALFLQGGGGGGGATLGWGHAVLG